MKERIGTALTALCLIFLIVAWYGVPWAAYVSVAFGGVYPVLTAFESLRERNIGISLLMLIAAAGAIAIGQAEEAAILLFLYSLSGTLEEFALGKTRSAIEALMKLRPETAVRLTNAGEEKVSIHDLAVGDKIRIAPFESVPIDGRILEGSTHVNEASMTGESVPVGKEPGEMVVSGTQNLEGMCIVEVTAAVGQTALDRIVEMFRDAQENKASGERISQWFGKPYTFVVLGAAVLSFLVRHFGLDHDVRTAFYESVILLVAMSPCALVISTPAATLSAMAWAARKGILIRGGEFIEALGNIDIVAVDKTGTLTQGRPKLVELCVCRTSGVDESACWHGEESMSPEAKEVLRLAAAAEKYSTHPIADAIVRAATGIGIALPEAKDQVDKPGYGVRANIDGASVRVGQPKFFDDLPGEFEDHVRDLQKRGLTVAILSVGEVWAALGLRDQARKESSGTISALRDLGVKRVVMLTGDNAQTADVVAQEVGVTEWKASLLPGDKTSLIEKMEAEGRVMMVGDGVNDAPSLARATVGVAMGGLGSDVALNSADVVLMGDRVAALPEIIRLGKKTSRIIWANLVFGGAVIGVLVLLSLFSVLPLPWAVVGHEGSTVLVILNGLRLLKGP
jgi:Cd2+/Zn2+-exporting ATPase